MKKINLLMVAFIFSLIACEKNFLEKIPETEITKNNFFNSVNDLKTYTNKFYDYINVSTADYSTDNMTRYSEGSELAEKLTGTLSVQTIGGWNDWGELRNINYFLVNYEKAEGDIDAINHYVGIARYFRAKFYIEKIQRYGSVPWFSKPLETNDEELLNKPNDPRNVVVDSIIKDLEFAAENISIDTDKSRLSKWAVFAEISRFCLYEGTYRKYHEELGFNNYDEFLEKSIIASEKIINSGNFNLYSTGNPNSDYRDFFTLESLRGVDEVIMFLDYDPNLRTNQAGVVLDYYWGLSKSLVDTYLMADGTRYTDEFEFGKQTFMEIFKNRDPRLPQTVMPPGYIRPGSSQPFVPRLYYGGYNQLKFFPEDEGKLGWQQAYNDLAVYRYAEILLNFAEAKAELGTITQADLDGSINLLRQRVGMPNLNIDFANANIDPILAEYYSNVSGTNKGGILEIRRERRVELACEGFREIDMYRWKAGNTLALSQYGIYVSELGELDVTGDGIPDLAILNSPEETEPINDISGELQNSLVKYYLYENGNPTTIFLSEGDKGFIGMMGDIILPESFIEPKYYYYPIPINELVLNPNLEQPPGW